MQRREDIQMRMNLPEAILRYPYNWEIHKAKTMRIRREQQAREMREVYGRKKDEAVLVG